MGDKQREIDVLRAESKSDLLEEVTKKDKEISDLQSKLENAETVKKLALSEALKEVEKKNDQLENDLKSKDTEKELLEKSLKEKFKDKLNIKTERSEIKR